MGYHVCNPVTTNNTQFMQATVDNSDDRHELSQRIKERALSEGFEKVGIVSAEKLANAHDRLIEWLGRGYQGQMAWMARDPEMRSDPRKLLPSAQSVVVVALNYYTPDAHTNDPATGKVSRYAWGDDYHDVVTPNCVHSSRGSSMSFRKSKEKFALIFNR